MTKLPHFVLFSRSEGLAAGELQSASQDGEHEYEQGGSWYFRILEDGEHVVLEASDFEPNMARERLELLAVVRGLEAFGQPSSITLRNPNPQISRAVRQGLDYWRDRNWMWEQFGEKVPMGNSDLWIRIDRAIQIHQIRCRTHRVDTVASEASCAARIPAPKMRNMIHSRPQPIGVANPLSLNGGEVDGIVDGERAGSFEHNAKALKQRSTSWMGRRFSSLNRFAANRLRNMAESLASLDRSGPQMAPNYSPEP